MGNLPKVRWTWAGQGLRTGQTPGGGGVAPGSAAPFPGSRGEGLRPSGRETWLRFPGQGPTSPPSLPGAPAFLPVPLRLGPRPAPPAAPLPLRHPQVVWQQVLSPGTPVARARVPAKLPPSGARGCSALKPRASGLWPTPALLWRGQRPKGLRTADLVAPSGSPGMQG